MRKLLAAVLAISLTGCATAHNGYRNGGWNPAYHNHSSNISDGELVALVGLIGAVAIIDSAQRRREHERELLKQKPAVIEINGIWYVEEYRVYKPCPTERKSQCILLTRTPIKK